MKLNYPKTNLPGFGLFGISVICGTYNLFVPGFLSEKFGISSGNNYNFIWIIAPIFIAFAFFQMFGVKRGEAILAVKTEDILDQEAEA